MKKGALVSAALGGVLLCLPTGASGQATLFGAEAMFGTDTDFGIGGRVHLDLGWDAPIDFQAGFDLFFPDGPADYWEINTNLWYNIPTSGSSSALPYLGGGLNIGHSSVEDFDDTELGVNLGGGVKFGFTNTIPFLEARVTLGGVEQFIIGGGVLFGG